jgi:hypothetical protein
MVDYPSKKSDHSVMPGLLLGMEERSVLYNLIVIGVVVACLVAINFAFDEMERRNLKR